MIDSFINIFKLITKKDVSNDLFDFFKLLYILENAIER